MIKCSSGLNHYGLRNNEFNSTNSECPRCNSIETWDLVACCRKIEEFCKQFVVDLWKDLIASKSEEVSYGDLFDAIEDILRFFDGKDDEEYDKNQNMVRMQHLFRGCAVKW